MFIVPSQMQIFTLNFLLVFFLCKYSYKRLLGCMIKNLSVDLQSQTFHHTKEKKYYIQTSSH